MKKYIYSMALATAMLTTACADRELVNETTDIPNSQKEMIAFSLSDGTGMSTRAGFIYSDTRIIMRMQSNERSSSGVKYTRTVAKAEKDNAGGDNGFSAVKFKWDSSNDYTRYWDDAHGRKSLLSIYAVAIPNHNDETVLPLSTLTAGDSSNENAWGSQQTNTLTWSVETAQTLDNIAKKDLVFSNNIKTGGTDGVYRWDYNNGKYLIEDTGAKTHKNGRMLFFQNGMTDDDVETKALTDAAGHFDRGHMVFNHALSRITVTLEKGTGFTESSPFAFATSTNIKMIGMPYSGTFDVADGTWAASPSTGEITTIAPVETGYTNAAGKYLVQVLPGYKFLKDGATNVFEFTIDDNTYYVTQKMLFDALTDSEYGALKEQASAADITMEMGKNYTFKIKVNKKEIESITATLVEWSDVEAADTSMKNGHINITTTKLSDTEGKACSDLYLYRYGQDLGSINTTDTYTATTYQENYLTEGNKGVQPTEETSSSNVWKTGWYFENNRTAYHIRSINSTAYGTNGANVKNTTGERPYTYFELANGAQYDHDFHWGAPMKSGSFKYDEAKGYENHLYPGITAINDDLAINITELHMMSNINVILKTTSDASAVALRTGTSESDYQYATVTLTRLYSKGTVDMGIGLVKTTGDAVTASEQITNPKDNTIYNKYFKQNGDSEVTTETNPFSWSVVPQSLKRGSDSDTSEDFYIGITIKTPDSNQYYVIKKLSEIQAKTTGTSQNQTVDKITRWYPNHNYTYTFTISKKGIENITCSVANWSDVVAEDLEINLED